jgi:glucose/mannose transport system permease protein
MRTLAVSGRRFSWRWLMYLVLVAGVVAFLVPVYMVIVTALKRPIDINLDTTWNLPKVWNWASFQQAWVAFAPKLKNSFTLTIVAALVSAMMGSLNGYVLSKWSFRGSRLMFSLMLFGMFIPYQSILIPLVQFREWVGLRGSITGLVMVHVIYGIAITTLIFRNYYAGVPTEVLEAGRIDGAGLFGLYRYIVFPLSIPAFVVVLIWQFTQAYNDFLFAVVLTSNQTWPVTVALNNLAGSQIVQWNVQMAGALLAALPTLLVYILLGRFFLRGLMAGALKG